MQELFLLLSCGQCRPVSSASLATTTVLQLFVRAGVYHGLEPVCPVQETKYQDSERPKWDQLIEFDLRLVDIPRAAKLCMGLCFVSRKRTKNKQVLQATGTRSLSSMPTGALSLSDSSLLVPCHSDSSLSRAHPSLKLFRHSLIIH